MIDTIIVEAQAERTSGLITTYIVDELGVSIPLASITTLTLTLYDEATNSIINSRNAQNVLNANGVTVTNGKVDWAVSPLDMVMVGQSDGTQEMHSAQFVLRWAAGAKEKAWQIRIPVYGFRRYF